MTSWNSSPEMSCKGCAVKRQLGAALLDGVVGWWGFPWGLIMTPVQIVRNVVDMIGGPKASQPSSMLERIVRIQSAAHVVQASQSAQPANG
jgi:hypothetical protein